PLPIITRLRFRRIGSRDRERRIERAQALYDAHRTEWEADVAKWARRGADFCRGFIGHLAATANQWVRGAAGLHRSAPVTELYLPDTDGFWRALARCPQLAHVSSLLLSGRHASREEAAALADSPHLGRLRSLRVGTDVHTRGDGRLDAGALAGTVGAEPGMVF